MSLTSLWKQGAGGAQGSQWLRSDPLARELLRPWWKEWRRAVGMGHACSGPAPTCCGSSQTGHRRDRPTVGAGPGGAADGPCLLASSLIPGRLQVGCAPFPREQRQPHCWGAGLQVLVTPSQKAKPRCLSPRKGRVRCHRPPLAASSAQASSCPSTLTPSSLAAWARGWSHRAGGGQAPDQPQGFSAWTDRCPHPC